MASRFPESVTDRASRLGWEPQGSKNSSTSPNHGTPASRICGCFVSQEDGRLTLPKRKSLLNAADLSLVAPEIRLHNASACRGPHRDNAPLCLR